MRPRARRLTSRRSVPRPRLVLTGGCPRLQSHGRSPAGPVVVTNWLNTSKNTTDAFPGAGDDALFNNGGVISVGGQGNADEILVQQNTTVMVTDTFISGVVSGQDPGPFDLAVDDGSKL